MDNKVWRNVSLVLAAGCMVLIGVSAALLYAGSSNPTPTIGPSTETIVSPSPTATTSPSATPSASPTVSASPSPKPTATPKPTPSAPIANITFSNMRLDATADAESKPRTFSFTSDGPGPVTASVVKASKGTTRLCFTVDGSKEQCWQGTKPVLNGTANSVHSAWTVTFIGVGSTTPTIDVAFTWPSNSADIKLTHGRLQGLGADSPLNGVTATFKARADGKISVFATWPPLVVDAVVTCADVTSTPAINGGELQFKDASQINPPASFDATTAHLYRIELRDLSADNYRPDLAFELSFP